jgi:hypothetical protein
MAHWRAGFWPRLVLISFRLTWELRITSYFADRTFPKKTSSTWSGLISGTRSTAAWAYCQLPYGWLRSYMVANSPLIAIPPKCVALRLERELFRSVLLSGIYMWTVLTPGTTQLESGQRTQCRRVEVKT